MTIDGVKIMNKQWMGHTEAFYKECFIYLKAKFSNKRPKAVGSEIYTEQPIYNETIVALEQIHNVLTKIENGSAYTREDYEDSVIKKEVDKTKEIIDFFKVLGLSSSDEMASAFDNFHKYYYWDSKIYRYKKFLHSSEEMKDWDRTELKMWSLEKFDATKFFDFLDRYKNFVDSSLVLSDEEGQKSDLINERIVEQNANYERLLSSYNNLLDQKVKFGVSVFDVNLPSSLNDLSDPDVRFFSSKFVAEFARYMDREFSGDDGVLLVINHAHVVSYNTFALSYLVIYKKKNYDSPEKLVEHYLKRTYTFAGTRKAEHIKVIDRGQMIKKIYPLDHFIGELKGEKQKIDFREKFLRYFLSSVFLLDVDKGTFLEEYFENLEVFKNSRAFSCFQNELIEEHESFLDKFSSNNRCNRKHLKEYFNNLVQNHRKLLLVRVDLSYRFNAQPDIKQFKRDVNKLVRRIQDKDTIFRDQVGYAYRLEQGGKSKGYHCHLLVIYNGSLRIKDDYLAQAIGELWLEKITKEDGQFFNCNQVSHKKYYKDLDQLGIGMIERRNLKEVENAWLAISYLADPEKDNQYLRASVKVKRQFSKGELKPRAADR